MEQCISKMLHCCIVVRASSQLPSDEAETSHAHRFHGCSQQPTAFWWSGDFPRSSVGWYVSIWNIANICVKRHRLKLDGVHASISLHTYLYILQLVTIVDTLLYIYIVWSIYLYKRHKYNCFILNFEMVSSPILPLKYDLLRK